MQTVEGIGHSFAKGLNHFGHNYAPFVIEFMGAYFLVMTIGLTAPVGNPLAPLAIGSILMVMVFMGGHLSGAHYNPAVTFGVLLAGRAKISLGSAFTYWFVQCLGGFLGALTAQGLNDAGSLASFTPRPLNDTHLGRAQAVFVEALYSFILATVVLNVATTKSQANNSFFGLGIGFTVVAAATAAGGLSGGVFNPAVGTGLTIVGSIYGGNTIQFLWIYWVGPMLGGAMSAVVFRVTNPKEYDLDFGVLPTTSTQSPLLPERDNSKSYEMYH